MKIGIITAMPEEFRAVADSLGTVAVTKLGTFRAGRFSKAGHEFLLLESGMGFDNAAGAAEMLIRDDRPDLLISTGFCGGIVPELQAGDVVVAKQIVIANDNGFEKIPVQLSTIGMTFATGQGNGENRIVAGTFISASTTTSKKHLAGMLSGRYPNPVVEMESGAIAIIAAENGIQLLAIRAVSDSAAEELEFSLHEFCDRNMRHIRPYKVLLTVLRKPRIIPQLVRLAFSSRRAAESITNTVSRLFPAC